MKELGERFLWGLAGAALCSGIALVNSLQLGPTLTIHGAEGSL